MKRFYRCEECGYCNPQTHYCSKNRFFVKPGTVSLDCFLEYRRDELELEGFE